MKMSRPVFIALAERLRSIPMRCANCRMRTCEGERRECPDAPEHSWEADDEALAREALAFAREQIGVPVNGCKCRGCNDLRDLRARLGVNE